MLWSRENDSIRIPTFCSDELARLPGGHHSPASTPWLARCWGSALLPQPFNHHISIQYLGLLRDQEALSKKCGPRLDSLSLSGKVIWKGHLTPPTLVFPSAKWCVGGSRRSWELIERTNFQFGERLSLRKGIEINEGRQWRETLNNNDLWAPLAYI